MRATVVFLMLICGNVLQAQDSWEPVLPSFGLALTLAANSHGHIFASGFYRSTDGGTTWVQINSGLPYGGLFLAVNPLKDDLFASAGNRIYRSTNNGDLWTLQDSTTFRYGTGRLVVNNQGILFVSSDTLRRSSDNGLTWTIAQNGLPSGQLQDLRIHANGDIYVARKGDWIFRSSNNGDSWIALTRPSLPPPPPGVDADAIAFGSGSQIYVGDDGCGFVKSTDGGSSWTQPNNGLPGSFVWAVAVNKQGHLFAGLPSGGIYRSTNGGAQWDSLNAGLDSQSRRIYSLLIAPSGYLLAGTTGGIYRSTQPVTDVGGDLDNVVTHYGLSQNYPNPFNPTTKIQFTVVTRQLTTLKVFDLIGRDVAVLVNEVKEPGTYTVEFQGSALSTGVYFYRLQAGDVIQTKRLLLLR